MTKEQLRIRIGENIMKQRVARKISRVALGKKMKVSAGTVGLMERGSRGATFLSLYKLADIFEVPIDAFFYDDSGNTNDESLSRKRKSLANLITGLPEKHLDYMIQMAKGLREFE